MNEENGRAHSFNCMIPLGEYFVLLLLINKVIGVATRKLLTLQIKRARVENGGNYDFRVRMCSQLALGPELIR